MVFLDILSILVSLGQSSSMWSGSFLHLKCLKGEGMYYSTFVWQYLIFTSLGIMDLLNVKIYECAYISLPPLLMIILL